jgi:hypothetical protein
VLLLLLLLLLLPLLLLPLLPQQPLRGRGKRVAEQREWL